MNKQGREIIARHEEQNRDKCRLAYFRHVTPGDMHISQTKILEAMAGNTFDHCKGHIGCGLCPFKSMEEE